MARWDQVYFHREAAERKLGFARAVRAGDWLLVSGCTATDQDGNIVGVGDMEAQVRQVYRVIGDVLSANGATFENVVKEVIYALDLQAFNSAIPIRIAAYEGVAPPAATGLEVSGLVHPDMLVEVEVTAWLPGHAATT